MIRKWSMWVLAATLVAPLPTRAETPVETPAENAARMAWWREARFGMFIHWGLYSVAGGQWEQQRCQTIASWIGHELRIPPDQYQTLRSGFTAERYDPKQWAALAKRAGMKYAVMTAKHHEGFCLFDSQFTDFDAMTTPARRDVARQFVDAFREAGLKVGFYHSMIDWHDANYPVKGDSLHPMRGNPVYEQQPRELAKYIDYLHNQSRELLTNYGPIDVMWWDFSYERMHGETWRARELMEMCRKLQPHIVMNNRLYLDAHHMEKNSGHGDFATPEQFIPPNGLPPGVDWETCMTINDTWGYKPHDLNFKTSIQLIRNLVDIASKGGNYLLNVGPRADGTIPQPLVERLEAIGDWMRVNGESIYGTTASPIARQLAWGRVTTGAATPEGGKLYLHVFDWPASREILVPLENRVRGVALLDGGETLVHRTSDKGTTVDLPRQPRHEAATVLVMEIEGEPVESGANIAPDNQGVYHLAAAAAQLNGGTLRYHSGGGGEGSIGFWTDANDWVAWTIDAPHSGRYRVEITYGCADDGGGEYAVEIGGQKLAAKSQSTGGWFDLRTDTVGEIDLPVGRAIPLAVRITQKSGTAVMDLKRLVLTPLPAPTP
jgi:alpha-L-fucosidase